MRIFLMLPFAFLALSASAAKIELWPVGNFGGFRVYAACDLDGQPADCMIDTASWNTILAPTPAVANYPSLEKVSLKGVGKIAFECDRIEPASFRFSGEEVARKNILRCPGFPEGNSPLVGSSLFASQSFSFSFKNGQLEWNTSLPSSSETLELTGSENGHIAIRGVIGASSARMLFDTGAPVSMVEPKFILENARCFRLSTLPPSEMMIRNKFVAYEMLCPVSVQGVELKADFVYSADLSPITGGAPFDLVLGANHLAVADWHFDLKNLRFSLNK